MTTMYCGRTQYSDRGMRVSDSDRQRAVEELRRHLTAGRLDVDEYSGRLEKALAATTLEELDHLRSDLPMLRIPDPVGSGTGRVWARSSSPTSTPLPLHTDRPARSGSARVSKTGALVLAGSAAAVVLMALILAVVAEWTWAVVLLAGWVAGVAQGEVWRRMRARRGSGA